MRHDIGRREDGGDGEGANNRIASCALKLFQRDDPGAFQQHQQHRQQERNAKAEDEFHHKIQIIVDTRKRLLLDTADIAAKAKQIFQRDGDRHIISHRRAGDEQDRRGQQEWQKSTLFFAIQAGRNEAP